MKNNFFIGAIFGISDKGKKQQLTNQHDRRVDKRRLVSHTRYQQNQNLL